MDAIVLLSGGQDSTTCLYWALRKFDSVHAVGFDYGQTHKIELEMARVIAQNAGVQYKVFDVKNLLDYLSQKYISAHHTRPWSLALSDAINARMPRVSCRSNQA